MATTGETYWPPPVNPHWSLTPIKLGPVDDLHVENGDLLVARLWRWDEERLREDAERERREQLASGVAFPDCCVSVWGMIKTPDCPLDALVSRLCEHMFTYRTAKWVAFTTDRRLKSSRFELRLREPPPCHYDLVLGTDFEAADYAGLAALFDEYGRRKLHECV